MGVIPTAHERRQAGGVSCRPAPRVVLTFLVAVAAAACSASTPSLIGQSTYGIAGARFAAAFPAAPKVLHPPKRGPYPDPRYGTTIASWTIWSAEGANVWVGRLEDPVPTDLAPGFLRSRLASPTRGQVTQRWGLPTAVEDVPCFLPAPGCSGRILTLVVLRGLTVYVADFHGPNNQGVAFLRLFRPAPG